VRDSKIAMLVNAPRYQTAASYSFSRREGEAIVPLGVTSSEQVRTFAGEER
jgi:hypothetical protein